MKRGRKIPFENVVRNLRERRYLGRICSAGYANEGVQLFQTLKFADNLGVPEDWLQEIGLVKITDQCGWHLPEAPTTEALLAARPKIEKQLEAEKQKAEEWKRKREVRL